MHCMNWWTRAAVAVFSFAAIGSANASWVLVDDFETFDTRVGALGGVNGWVETSGTTGAASDFRVVVDPDDAGNKALSITRDVHTHDSAAYKALGQNVADGTTGTLFFRIRNFINPTAPNANNADGTPRDGLTSPGGDLSAGASDSAAPSGYGSFEGYMTTVNGEIRVRDGGSAPTVGSYAADTWTNYWLVLNNAVGTEGQTDALYSSTGNGPAIFLGSGAFRTGNDGDGDGDLLTFQIRSGFGQTSAGYIDDIYVNTMGAALTNPLLVPEPSALLLFGMATAACVIAAARRRIS